MPNPTPSPLTDRVVLLLTNGMSAEAAEGYCVQQGQPVESARQIVLDARQRITIAADYTRVEQLGKAVIRLDDLYAKSISERDIRTALQAQRELNRLLSLYADKDGVEGGTGASGEGSDAQRQLDLIASYLLPLKLTDERYPLEEHVRVACEILRSQHPVPPQS